MNEERKLYNIFLSKDFFYTPSNNNIKECENDKDFIVIKNVEAEDVFKIFNSEVIMSLGMVQSFITNENYDIVDEEEIKKELVEEWGWNFG